MPEHHNAADIPGMIEDIEQRMLRQHASECPLEPNDSIVEFGTYFGRSTACIAEGLSLNSSYADSNIFYAYDSFQCHISGVLAPYVMNSANSAGVSNLLEKKDNFINFKPVFEHYLRPYIQKNSLVPVTAELQASTPPEGDIALLHIDSPKFYSEFKSILFRFLPRMKSRGTVIFQDFFYHWSASLIAICALLMKEGFISFQASAASSLITTVEKPLSVTKAVELDLAMQADDCIPNLVDFAIASCSKLTLDRPEVFLPRLALSKLQWLFDNGRHNEARQEFVKYFNSGGKLNNEIIADFLELLGHGFSIRKLYERDHSLSK